MRTKISLGLLIISASAIVSCKKELEPQESSTAVRATETTSPNKTVNATPLQQSTTQTPTNNTQNITAGINPAHGKPGHRCDIAVGAPLNSKPTPQTTQVNPSGQTIQLQNQTVTTTQPVKTAKGMNPPHGQPGHRCDIAVGAPLNSKPNTATASKDNGLGMTVTPANVSKDGAITPQNNSTPALLSTGNTTATAPGMNPVHGQPGHRCDIPVGSPLSQEKKTDEKKSE